jgi:peptide deformylase
VRAQDRHGSPFEATLEDMRAVCLLHEVDHLDGRLFIDRLPAWRRLLLRLSRKARARSAA